MSFLKKLNVFFPAILLWYNVFSQDCEVIRYNTTSVVKDDEYVTTDSVLLQVNNRNGENYTEVSISYSKLYKISNLNAWIEDMDGNIIRKLKNSEITDRSAISYFSLYEDDYVKSFQLKHNVYPYRIFYTVQTTHKYFIGDGWNPLISYKIPTRSSSLTLMVPIGKQVKFLEKNIQDHRTDTTGNNIRYHWNAAFQKKYTEEEYSPSYINFTPLVIIMPLHFKFVAEGNSSDWKSFGSWYYNLISNLDELPQIEKLRIDKAIAGISDKKEIVKILYRYMQDHMRYINVSLNTGGLKPYPASYVCENKYGDCKALSNYMKAVLKYAGIPSYYTVIQSDDTPENIPSDFASGFYFNHIILTAPLGNDTIWLENTSNILPFGYLHTSIQNRKALLVDENNSRLINIPVMKNENVRSFGRTDVTFDETSNADVTTRSVLSGYYFEVFNRYLTEASKEEQEKVVHKYLPFLNYDLINWKLQQTNRDSAFISLSTHLNLYKVIQNIGDERYFSISQMNPFELTSPQKRTLPVQISCPYISADTVCYHFRNNAYVLKKIPGEVSLHSKYGNYNLQVKEEDSAILVTRRIELYPGYYPLEEYKEFYNFMYSICSADKTKLVVRKKP